jgi:hypothetical protein
MQAELEGWEESYPALDSIQGASSLQKKNTSENFLLGFGRQKVAGRMCKLSLTSHNNVEASGLPKPGIVKLAALLGDRPCLLPSCFFRPITVKPSGVAASSLDIFPR